MEQINVILKKVERTWKDKTTGEEKKADFYQINVDGFDLDIAFRENLSKQIVNKKFGK